MVGHCPSGGDGWTADRRGHCRGRGSPACIVVRLRVLDAGGDIRIFKGDGNGGGLALGGAALFYESASLLAYAAAFLLAAHFFVVVYEEPTLRRGFGAEYEAYCQRVRRWRPGL